MTASLSGAELRLPFSGRWFVAQGGDTLNVNNHMRVKAQFYGIDFIKTGGPEGRNLSSKPQPVSIEDFYSWGEQVLAPADGEVIGETNNLPDNPLGTKDPANPGGNQVSLRIAPNCFVFIAHMQKGSVKVKAGDKVKAGQLLGLCGNSGNSDAPHVHLHLQDTPKLNDGIGQKPEFHDIKVELTGKIFRHADWPLIRGLFVEQE